MTSINTNTGAMAALATLRSMSSSLSRQQNLVATGLRVSEARDNAAYWSISVGMRSTVSAISVVQDALGFSAAVADVTYAALEKTVEVLTQVRDRVLMASADGTDLRAIQQEISQLAAQTQTIANSGSFGGTNWLVTDVEDLFDGDPEDRSTKLISSYTDSGSGTSVQHIPFDLSASSLFNSTGGGMLQADPRSPKSIGGIRFPSSQTETGYWPSNSRQGTQARRDFMFTGPMDFSSGGSITFDVTVDKDNPSHDIDPPYSPGTTSSITIDLSVVNAALGTAAGGIVSDYVQYIAVLSRALSGSGVSAARVAKYPSGYVQDQIALFSNGGSGHDGSQLALSNLVADMDAGGLSEFGDAWGMRGNEMTLHFEPFKIYRDVEVNFVFRVNGSITSFSIDRATVDSILGRDDGRVDTADEMATLLEAVIGRPGLEIEASGGTVTIGTDRDDRLAGNKSRLGFDSISVSIEPITAVGIMDIDVEANPGMIPAYLSSVNTMLSRVIDGAARVGSLRMRIDLQTAFNSMRSDAIERGIGQLVDADMEKASVRLQALKVQQQIAITALGIANGHQQAILQLFARS